MSPDALALALAAAALHTLWNVLLARVPGVQAATALRDLGVHVETGAFGARMQVELVNDGPVTNVLDM